MPLRHLVGRRPPSLHRLPLLTLPLAAALLLASGCGDKSTAPPPPPVGASITVSPMTARVILRGTLDLSASVQNLSSTAVTWSLSRMTPTPDTVSLGTLVATGPTTATYTAPDRVVSALDYKILITATSVANDTVKAGAIVTVPHIRVTVIPGYLASVLPGTLVPYSVAVENTPDPGFALFVQGVPGGDASVGTWTQTGAQSAVYRAPDALAPTSTLDLFVRSADDSTRFGSSQITVRRGAPLPIARPDLSQYAPEWSPNGWELAFVQGGPPWEVAVYNFVSGVQRTLTTFEWSASAYDGRLSWSDDGSRIAFGKEEGGRRAIGVVPAGGGAHTTFAPDPAADYFEGVFVPKVDPLVPDSLVVSQTLAGGSSLREYPLSYGPGEAGRVLYGALRRPDAARIRNSAGRQVLWVAAQEPVLGSVVTFADGGGAGLVVASGAGPAQVHWAQQIAGPLWVTYIKGDNRTAYRVQRLGIPPPIKLYSEFFPELGMDLGSGQGYDAHAVSRLMPDGSARIWVVEFPPQSFGGVSRAEELELASIGIRGALAPSSWGRWLGAYDPALGAHLPMPTLGARARAR